MAGADDNDPFSSPNHTVLRPRPGGAKRAPPGQPPAHGGQRPPPVPPAQQGLAGGYSDPRAGMPGAAAGRAPLPGSMPAGKGAAVQDFLVTARNRLLSAANPLLVLGSQVSSAVVQADIDNLRRQAVQQVHAFEERARAEGIANEDVLAGRYALCTFVDAAVFNTPWGAGSNWAGQSLLSLFHKEASGGEKFFAVLDRILTKPERYIDLIELHYVCLLLGFEGKYRLDPRGAAQLAQLQDHLRRVIRGQRAVPEAALSPHWQGVEDRRNPIVRYVPWWVVGAVAFAILAGTWAYYRASLGEQAQPIHAALAGAVEAVNYEMPPSERAPTRLKQLLATPEEAGLLTVEETGDRSIVTLLSPELFRSASASIRPEYEATLRGIGMALDQVPGRIAVIGHTDDLPLRSLRYADNYELSRERAEAVFQILQSQLASAERVERRGVGDSQPRYLPANTPENRARNRRVEIIHYGEPRP